MAEASRAAARAYAPYSGFAVGAVVVGASGAAYRGVNVESAAFPAGMCAERAALSAMVSAGERAPDRVAVATADGRDCTPCGVCLQALAEFGEPLVIARVAGEPRVFRLGELLSTPFGFPGGPPDVPSPGSGDEGP